VPDSTTHEPLCCVADWYFPAAWFNAVNEAAQRAFAESKKPLPFSPLRAPAALAGTKYDSPGFEGIAIGQLQANLKWAGGGGKITVGFLDGTAALIDKVQAIAPEWCKYANIDFDFVTGRASANQADIRVSFSVKKQFYSVLAKQSLSGKPSLSMSLGFNGGEVPAEFRRLILHEFGHAIGLQHEHMNPEGGIEWDENRAVSYLASRLPHLANNREALLAQLRLIDAKTDMWMKTAFDIKSVMRYTFPKDIFRKGWDEAFDVENTDLSDGDKAIARQLYPGRAGGGDTGGTDPVRVKTIEIDRPESGTIRQGEVYRYNFQVSSSGEYVITTSGAAVVRIELFGQDGKPAITRWSSDALDASHGATLTPLIASGSYYVTLRSSPFSPGVNGEGDYTLTLKRA
jgi:hypothetical protein